MKRMVKGLGFAAASLLMIGSMASCGNKLPKFSDDDMNEFAKVVYMTTGNKPSDTATQEMLKELNKILKEKANAELEIYYIPWTNYQTQYNLTLAQMDGTVDLVGTASDWLDAWKNSKNGAFCAIPEEEIQKWAPKTWNSVSKEHWDMCRYDGKIYLMPEDNYAQWINHGFMYRGDWAREAGLKDGVHSWEDMTKYFEYLTGLKKSNFYAWDSTGASSTFHADGYIQSKSDYIALDGINTLGTFGVRRSNLKKIYSPFMEGDELVEYAKLMKEWDEMGVWKKAVFNSPGDTREELYLGQTGVDQHHTQTWYTTVRPQMDEKQPGSDVGFFWFGEESGNVTTMTITHGAMAISAASKHKRHALAVYDLLRNDPECYRLFNYGIEGKQYEVLDADKNVIKASEIKYVEDENGNLKIDGEYYYRPVLNEKGENAYPAIVTDYWWGRNDNLEIRNVKGAWDKFDEICAVYDKVKVDYPYGQIVWDVDSIQSELSNISDVWSRYMGNICYGKTTDPESDVKKFRQELKQAGIDRAIAELQSQLDAFNKKNK